MSQIFMNIDGELNHFNVYNSTLVSILENFKDDGDETVITVTIEKRSDADG